MRNENHDNKNNKMAKPKLRKVLVMPLIFTSFFSWFSYGNGAEVGQPTQVIEAPSPNGIGWGGPV